MPSCKLPLNQNIVLNKLNNAVLNKIAPLPEIGRAKTSKTYVTQSKKGSLHCVLLCNIMEEKLFIINMVDDCSLHTLLVKY